MYGCAVWIDVAVVVRTVGAWIVGAVVDVADVVAVVDTVVCVAAVVVLLLLRCC